MKYPTGKIVIGVVLVILLVFGIAYAHRRASALPSQLVLPVPFTTQAPGGNWQGNENCEEASAIMANAYLTGNTAGTLSGSQVQKDMNSLIVWEQTAIGHNANTGADQTAQMIVSNYHLHTQQIQNYTALDLKKALSSHSVILLMIDASKLGNPTYQNDGRLYHVIVVRGFVGDVFVVNDPGTEKGNGQKYSFTTLQNAAADWDQTQHVLEPGKKVALVVSK